MIIMYFYRIVKSYNIITPRRLLAYLNSLTSNEGLVVVPPLQTRPHSRKGNNCLCKIWRHGGFRIHDYDDDGQRSAAPRKIPHNLTNNHIICANLDCCCCKNVAAAIIHANYTVVSAYGKKTSKTSSLQAGRFLLLNFACIIYYYIWLTFLRSIARCAWDLEVLIIFQFHCTALGRNQHHLRQPFQDR